MTGRYLGIDVGGTNTKCVVVEAGPTGFTARDLGQAPTITDLGAPGVRDWVIRVIRNQLAAAGPFDGIGVTVPGTVDVDLGTTGVVPNIEGDWDGFEFAGPVSAAVGLPVQLINDARAFALAEATIGAARGLDTVVCVTLGTGIGGGVVRGGALHRGHTGLAGEIGHQTVEFGPDAERCGCGNLGCLESVAKAETFCWHAQQPDVKAVFAAVAANDPVATAALHREVRYLGAGLANAYALLGPDAFVVGGGIAQAGEALLEPLVAEVRRRVPFERPEAIQILVAELGPNAGAIGAGLWAHARQPSVPTALAR